MTKIKQMLDINSQSFTIIHRIVITQPVQSIAAAGYSNRGGAAVGAGTDI